MKFLHETEIAEKAVPGRFLRWITEKGGKMSSDLLSCCVMRVLPGQTVTPAHEHPDGEELLYFIEGAGHVYVDGEICSVSAGSLVLFEQGSVHMVRNSGETEMKVVCFFSPATSLDEYVFHKEINFDEGVYI